MGPRMEQRGLYGIHGHADYDRTHSAVILCRHSLWKQRYEEVKASPQGGPECTRGEKLLSISLEVLIPYTL